MNATTKPPALTDAELARAAELGGTSDRPGWSLIQTRAAFEGIEDVAAGYRAQGYRSVGRTVRRCGDEHPAAAR